MTIKNFTIYGERCSGTNYIEHLIKENFKINFVFKYDWKHFFGSYNFGSTNEENETLFIGIIRNPIDWIFSFYKNPHHIPIENITLPNFILNEFYSVNPQNMIIEKDLNYITKQKYKNIFEMRKMKNDYLINIMPTKVKNYILINYEHARDNPELLLKNIQEQFNLEYKHDTIQKIINYKGISNIVFSIKPTTFSNDILDIILNNLDIEQEKSLGYVFDSHVKDIYGNGT
jgi:hypothetical protein